MRPNIFRRKYLINPRFQLSFIAHSIGTAFVVGGVFYAALRFYFYKLEQFGLQEGLPPDHVLFVFLREQLRYMNNIFIIAFGIIGFLLVLHGVLFSHKVAGPLYRFHQHMKGLARGTAPSKLKFRKGDYFPELAEAFNELKTETKDSKAA